MSDMSDTEPTDSFELDPLSDSFNAEKYERWAKKHGFDVKPKRVLITGIGGFMGSHVLRHLLTTTDWEIVGIDSFRHMGKTDRITQQLDGLDADTWNRITIITHDLTVPISRQMDEKIGDIDYVLNIASESHVDRSISSPRDFIENNISLMLTMLEWLKERSKYQGLIVKPSAPKKFIHISTDEVYGPAYTHNHKEGEPHRPSNPYSASKAAQENICYAYWRTYELPIIITNTMNIIGEMQDPEKYIPKIIQEVFNDGVVPVHASPEGVIGSRYYLHARNQADALKFILENVDAELYNGVNFGPETFNIVGEREVDNLEVAQLVASYAGKKLQYELTDFHSSRPGHDLRYALDGTKLQSLGWKPPMSFEDSLKQTVEWTIANPQWLK